MKKSCCCTKTSWPTRFFLVLLRLAIGWHLFIEGATKLETWSVGPSISNKPFSSRGYLQQSQGPLGPLFRNMAGDPDATLLTLLDTSSQAIPPALEKQWQDYVNRYSAHYQLDNAQRQQADILLKQHLQMLQTWFKDGKKEVTRDYPFATTIPTLSTATRISTYRNKHQELRGYIDQWNVLFSKDVTKSRVSALRSEVSKLRTELQQDLDELQKKLGQELDKLLTKEQEAIDFEKYMGRLISASNSEGNSSDHQALAELKQAAREVKNSTFTVNWDTFNTYPESVISAFLQDPDYRKLANRIGKREMAPPLRVEDTRLLDWADRSVAWGLTLAGLGLLLGCFTRLSSLVGAGLLMLFYVSLPPLPDLPENPLAEGKYLFVNKNLIEALALLVLATTASGRWFGIDALLSCIWPFKYFWPGEKPEASSK
ncbi:MAG: hypothetical protein JNJ77_14930 [Planctomycetia bacterium]|nr:hypothetical protein [Planctomycetia bacterium]